jgi:hypothetical protein
MESTRTIIQLQKTQLTGERFLGLGLKGSTGLLSERLASGVGHDEAQLVGWMRMKVAIRVGDGGTTQVVEGVFMRFTEAQIEKVDHSMMMTSPSSPTSLFASMTAA